MSESPATALRQYVPKRHPGGWRRRWSRFGRWLQDLYEVAAFRHSLHSAWQSGYDQHILDESKRIANTTTHCGSCKQGVDVNHTYCPWCGAQERDHSILRSRVAE